MDDANAKIHASPHHHWGPGNACGAAGAAFFNGKLHKSTELVSLLQRQDSPEALKGLLARLNGMFSLVVRFGNGTVCAAVDRGRTRPLFYSETGGLFISDDALWIAGKMRANSVSLEPLEDMLLTCSVSGADTLLPEIKQLQIGEMLTATPKGPGWSCKVDSYFNYFHNNTSNADAQFHNKLLENALESSVARLLEYAGGRPIALALSGGLDSTMLAVALKKSGYRDVSAFSYGRRGSTECAYSSHIAQNLGLPWGYIEYSGDKWVRWLKSEDRRDYWQYSHNLSALPHIQDWPAIGEGLENGAIQPGSVVVSGMSVEAFYGIQFAPEDWQALERDEIDEDAIARLIFKLHYRLWTDLVIRDGTRERMLKRIKDSLGPKGNYSTTANYFEAWVVREKMGKFNNNSVRAYEYWGLDWWYPLWDKAVIDFWLQIPWRIRRHRAFTRGFVSQYYTRHTGRPYSYFLTLSPIEKAAKKFRAMMWRFRPAINTYVSLKRSLQYRQNRMDWYGAVPREVFNGLFHHRFNINSLLMLEFVGALDLGLGGATSAGFDWPLDFADEIQRRCRH